MNFEERAAKPILRTAGIETPEGRLATTAEEAARIAAEIGPCAVKAQVPAVKRGKAGGIRLAGSAEEAREHAQEYLVEQVLVEALVPIAHEMYAGVVNAPGSKSALLLLSPTRGHGHRGDRRQAASNEGTLVKRPSQVRQNWPATGRPSIFRA
jgi:succinyl-CoA synthetase beta subunit